MNDLPYTDVDLRIEAAAQHAVLTEDPDFMGVGEGMEDSLVESTETDGGGKTWAELLPYEADGGKAYNDAQRKIHELIPGADVSEWAIDLGADGLEPSRYAITLNNDEGPFVRIHFAFHPDMVERDRERFMRGVRHMVERDRERFTCGVRQVVDNTI